MSELERLRAKIARLREALAGIAQASFCRSPGCCINDPMCDAMIAEAALSTPADGWLEHKLAEERKEEREQCIRECVILSGQWFDNKRNSWGMAAAQCAAELEEGGGG